MITLTPDAALDREIGLQSQRLNHTRALMVALAEHAGPRDVGIVMEVGARLAAEITQLAALKEQSAELRREAAP